MGSKRRISRLHPNCGNITRSPGRVDNNIRKLCATSSSADTIKAFPNLLSKDGGKLQPVPRKESSVSIIVLYLKDHFIIFLARLYPISTVKSPSTIVPPCAVESPILAAGLLPISTVEEPLTIVSGGPVHVAISPTTMAGTPPINTVESPGPVQGPPTW